jgi:serine/threonine-protein kinase
VEHRSCEEEIVLDQLPQSTIVEGTQGRYEVLGSVGRGGMGIVYRARRHPDGLLVALKEMRPPENTPPEEIAERRLLFAQEAELLLGLDHPNIVKGYEVFEWRGQPYFIMEFVNGVGLEKRLRETNAPAFEQDALTWGVHMARVLAYLHTRQPPIIYRDLKPENVILTPDGTIKFIDFGVARTYKARKAKDTVAIGTYGYAPPEQYGKGQTDARSDIYTLGATLYHLLTNLGPVPLRTPEPGSIMQHNPSVKPQTEQVIIRAMQQDRDKRFANAAEMEAALNACLAVPIPPLQVAPEVPVAMDATQRTVTPVVPPKARRPVQPASRPAQQPAVQRGAPVQPPPSRPAAAAPAIGTTSPAIFCPHCGRANKPTARFCAACGTVLPPTPQVAPATSRPQVTAPPRQAARPLQQARFRISTPRGTWEFPLTNLPCRIGRRDPSQSHFPELDLADYDRGHASRRHAVIERRGSQYVLTDVGSVNGTLLNGVRLPAHRPQPLKVGDRIRIGDVEMHFEWA